jgi:rhodanese-related sulfurtransferase
VGGGLFFLGAIILGTATLGRFGSSRREFKMKKSLYSLLAVLLVSFGPVSSSYAVEASKVPKDKQNALGNYVTSAEANMRIKNMGAKTLFLDIRDPVEINTVGMPSVIDYNVPFKLIDTTKWDSAKGKFAMKSNPDFLNDVAARLKAKGLSKGDEVIAICGSGKRAAKAVNAMAKAGYKNAYSVVDGYKGWQKNGLPIDTKLNRGKIYGNPK